MLKANIAGTTIPIFQIGIDGPTIYEGNSIPLDSFGNDGDIFIHISKFLQKEFGKWIDIGAKSWLITGSIPNVGKNSLTDLEIQQSAEGIPMFRDGKILGISIISKQDRTAGTCEFSATINGNPVGQTIQIDGIHPKSNFIEFTSNINYLAGDFINARTSTTDFNPFGADMTGILFLQDT